MRILYADSSIEDFAARIYCFSQVNELWKFKEEVGAAVWIHILERSKNNGGKKGFKLSLEGDFAVIHRTR